MEAGNVPTQTKDCAPVCVRSVCGPVFGSQTYPRAGQAGRKARMQAAGDGGAAEAEGGGVSGRKRESRPVSVGAKGAQRASRLRVPACEWEQEREAFSGIGPRREASQCPLPWEPPYRVKGRVGGQGQSLQRSPRLTTGKPGLPGRAKRWALAHAQTKQAPTQGLHAV